MVHNGKTEVGAEARKNKEKGYANLGIFVFILLFGEFLFSQISWYRGDK
jgi:hypothetical protein